MVFCRHISQRVFAPTPISLLQFPILSFSQFVTITDSIDVYYYLFDGEPVCHQEGLARMVEHLLSMQQVLISIIRFSSYKRSSNSFFAGSNVWK